MMPEINQIILVFSGSAVALVLVKVTITTALGLIGARLARRSRAALRHALLAAAFVVLAALPIVSLAMPPIRILLRLPEEARKAVVPFAKTAEASVTRTVVQAPTVSRSYRLSLSDWLLMVWLTGTLLFLLPMAIGLRRLRALRRAGTVWTHGQSIAKALSESGDVEVLLHEALPGPITCGMFHTAILLPLDAPNWTEQDLHRALVHELEHVQRRDWLSQCVARTICAAYWFHPLVWMAWRKLLVEAERACDDAVLRGSEATAYAEQLLALAERLSSVRRVAANLPMVAMANRADLVTRVGAVLDQRQERGRAGVLRVVLAFAGAAALVATIAPLRMVAAPQAASTDARTTFLPRFSSTTAMVVTPVTVTDQNGAPIQGLTREDFRLLEDNVTQVISVFELADSQATGYVLGYYPRNPQAGFEFRDLRVSLDRPNATVRARKGYFASLPEFDDHASLDPTRPVVLRKVEAGVFRGRAQSEVAGLGDSTGGGRRFRPSNRGLCNPEFGIGPGRESDGSRRTLAIQACGE